MAKAKANELKTRWTKSVVERVNPLLYGRSLGPDSALPGVGTTRRSNAIFGVACCFAGDLVFCAAAGAARTAARATPRNNVRRRFMA